MRSALAVSIGSHLFVVVLILIGLPRLERSPPAVEQLKIISMVDISAVTNAPAQAAPRPDRPATTSTKKPVAKKTVSAKSAAKTIKPKLKPQLTPAVSATPPPPAEPNLPKKLKPATKAAPVKAEKPQAVTAVVRPAARPKPPQPKSLKPDKVQNPAPSAFDNLLRSVAKIQPAVGDRTARKAANKLEPHAAAIAAPNRRFNQDAKLSVSELDTIRDQIADCWNIPAGAKGAEDLIVDIFVRMNPDGTVRTAEVTNKSRMRVDPFFRTAAESAIRALRNPRCAPLRLPANKFDLWKTFTIGFNPREMLG